jgi:hypothetical protein
MIGRFGILDDSCQARTQVVDRQFQLRMSDDISDRGTSGTHSMIAPHEYIPSPFTPFGLDASL